VYGNLSLIAPHFDINDVLVPHTGWRPLQLLGCPTPDHFANGTAELQLQTPDRPRSPFYSTINGMDGAENKTLHPTPEENHQFSDPPSRILVTTISSRGVK